MAQLIWLKSGHSSKYNASGHIFSRATLCVSAVLAVCRCPSTLVYCIQTAKVIIKRFSRPGSHIILVFLPQARFHNSKRTPQRGVKRALEKMSVNISLYLGSLERRTRGIQFSGGAAYAYAHTVWPTAIKFGMENQCGGLFIRAESQVAGPQRALIFGYPYLFYAHSSKFVYLFAWGLTALSAQLGYIAPQQ